MKGEVDLSYAFNLPPEKAIEYFRSKGYTFSWDWRDTWQQAHARAFTVAKAMRLDILQDIRGAVDKALTEGQTFDQFRKELTPVLQKKGWWGKTLIGDGEGGGQVVQLGSPRRLQTIYQVNLQTAYMAGQYKSLMENVENRPYWMYVAVLDSRTRPGHRVLHGIIARYDSPFWRYFYPPNGWRCRCRVRGITKDQAITMVKNGQGTWVKEGDLSLKDLLINETTGEMNQVAVYKATGLDARPLSVSPDAGWSYNPGEAWLQPFIPRPFDPETMGSYKTVGAQPVTKPPIESLPAKPLTKDMLLPSHQSSGWSEAKYVDTFLGEFKASIGKPTVFEDVIGDPVVISEELFRDRKENVLKVFKADREIYLKLLADTIKDPAEIWLTEVEGGNGMRLCKRYVGLYQDEKQKMSGFVVFDLVDGMWQGTTAFRPRNLANLDKQRAGLLLYTKE